ncbi:MAG: hypothetical protein ACXWRU_18715 [Pseudobdellovibrionaceae bacterium]
MLLCLRGYSGNDPLISAYNQAFVFKKFCAEVKLDEVKSCYSMAQKDINKNQLLQTSFNVGQVVENLIFQEAVRIESQKSLCLQDKLNLLRTNQDYFVPFKIQSAFTFLRYKKAELMLQKCKNINNPRNLKVQIHKDWLSVCKNTETMDSLKAAKDLFLLSLPTFNSEEILTETEKYRKAIINKTTRKPVSDEELLQNDLRDASWITIESEKTSDESKNFSQSLQKIIEKQEHDRSEIAKELEKKVNNDFFLLSPNQKDFLYEDGAVEDALLKYNMIKEDPLTLEQTYSNGAACILSKLQPAPGAELAEFAMTLLGTALSAPKVMARLGRIKKMTPTIQKGSLVLGVNMLSQGIIKKCTDQAGTRDSLPSTRIMDRIGALNPSQLPDTIAYSRKTFEDLDLDPKLEKSCHGEGNAYQRQPGSLLADSRFLTCAANMVLSMLPLKYSLPASYLAD